MIHKCTTPYDRIFLTIQSASLVEKPASNSPQPTQTTLTQDICDKPAPTPVDFKVPSNQTKHNLTVSNQMTRGSLKTEAEQIIAAKKCFIS